MESGIDNGLFWVAFWIYLSSFLLFILFSATKNRMLGRSAKMVFLVSLAFHTAGLIARWNISGHLPLATMYEYAVSLSWVIAASFIILLLKFSLTISGVVISPIVIIIMVIASFLPKEASRQLMPALQSYWFYIHITLAALAEGAFLVAAGGGGYYLLKRARGGAGFEGRDSLEELMIKSIRIGYPLFTVGALFAGALWAWKAWGRFWSWDPKETGAFVVWLFYTLLLHQYSRGKWRGTALAALSIVGFLIILISFLGNMFFGGLHAYI